MAHIFNGKKYSSEKEQSVLEEVNKLKKRGIFPKLVSILVGEDKSSKLFLALKKKAAERIGVKVEVRSFGVNTRLNTLMEAIKDLGDNKQVDGVIIQLPLPEEFSKGKRNKIINSINPGKDVDGMRDDSPFSTPAVKAVLTAIKEASTYINSVPKVVLVGAEGFVGTKIVKAMKKQGYDVLGIDLEEENLARKTKNADILISTTGQEGLIKGNMVKEGAVVIDVGAPSGDVAFDEAVKKALFITPVPGGIGPVTIFYLLENLVEAAERLHKRV